MTRHQWTPRQLRRFVAPVPQRSGYPNLMLRVRTAVPAEIRAHASTIHGGCWRPWQLAEWSSAPVFAVLAELSAPMSGIKYPDICLTRGGLRVELHYYTPTPGDPVNLARTAEVIHALQALGARVDVLGWRHGQGRA